MAKTATLSLGSELMDFATVFVIALLIILLVVLFVYSFTEAEKDKSSRTDANSDRKKLIVKTIHKRVRNHGIHRLRKV